MSVISQSVLFSFFLSFFRVCFESFFVGLLCGKKQVKTASKSFNTDTTKLKAETTINTKKRERERERERVEE